MRIESKMVLRSSLKRVFDILADGINAPIWNPAIDTVAEMESAVESPYYFLKTALGNIKIINTEIVRNEHITYQMAESMINSMGYSLVGKGNQVEILVWAEFSDPKNNELLRKTADILLVGLRRYVGFLEDGGSPEEYDKSGVLISAV